MSLKINSPCSSVTITPPNVGVEIYWYESVTKPSLEYIWDDTGSNAWVVDPDYCKELLTFECEIQARGVTLPSNSCSFTDGLSQGTFDTKTGNLTFKTRDMVTFPPFTLYSFFLSGTINNTKRIKTLKSLFQDPCPQAKITIVEPNVFSTPI